MAALRRATEPVWQEIDTLMTPSIPTLYTVAEVDADPIRLNSRLGVYTNFVNLLDLAALAVPSWARDDGRPAGVTFISPRGRDALLAGLGRKLCAIARGRRDEDAATTAAPPGFIEVAVFGAHMSGLPLNGELQALGAQFLRVAETTPDYEFYALPGGPPHRPGLVRSAPNEGASIACEIWVLPAEGFGQLVAAVPAPLAIGTISLSDGVTCKGYIAEAEGIRGAEKITRYGGWRAFLAAKPH